jgi:hypothetical protein
MKVDAPVDLSGTWTGDLHGVLREAASQGPLATDILTGATVVLRQGDLEVLAHDQRLPGIGLALFDMTGIPDGPLRDWYGKLMFTTEGDYHRRIRSLVSRAFTPRSVEALRATAADMAAVAVASVRQGGDLVAACSALATRLICRLLGVPDSDVEVFREWAEALSPVFFVMTPEQIAYATQAITELQTYVDGLTTRRAEDPGSDLVTALRAAEADGECLTHTETVNMIANLLVAGHDTAGARYPAAFWWPCSIATSSVEYTRTTFGWPARPPRPCAWSQASRSSPEPPLHRSICTARRSRPARWSSCASPPRAAMKRRGANPINSTLTVSPDPTQPSCRTSVRARTTAWARHWPRLQWKSRWEPSSRPIPRCA